MRISELPQIYRDLFELRYKQQDEEETRKRLDQRPEDDINHLYWEVTPEGHEFWEELYLSSNESELPDIPESSISELKSRANPNLLV